MSEFLSTAYLGAKVSLIKIAVDAESTINRRVLWPSQVAYVCTELPCY